MPRLENWSLVRGFDPYQPPEAQLGYLKGVVYGHRRLKDGQYVLTSALVRFSVSTRRAKTYSGSDYFLGKPDPKWVEWLEENEFTEFLEDLRKFTSTFIN